MYIIVACSRCRLARTAQADQKTAECPRCGRRIDLKDTRVYLVTEDMNIAAAALASVNETLAGGPPVEDGTWGDLNVDGREDIPSNTTSGRRNVLSHARSLSIDGASFTAIELAERAEMPVDRIGPLLEKWSSEGVVYSPSHGSYTLVDP